MAEARLQRGAKLANNPRFRINADQVRNPAALIGLRLCFVRVHPALRRPPALGEHDAAIMPERNGAR